MHSLLHYHITLQNGTYFTKDEPALIHHYYLSPIAHVKVLSPFKPPLELEEPFSNVIWRVILYV